MSRNNVRDKKNLIITIIVIVLIAAAAAGLFLFFTLYDFGGTNRSGAEQTPPIDTLSQSTPNDSAVNTSSNTTAFTQLDDPLLVLVNADHKMPDGTDDGVVEQYDITLDKRALDAYGQMYQAASKDGITLWISSGYRSPTLQAQLYQQEIDDNLAKGMTENEAVEEADRAVQKPGYSEHNTGLAMDFNTVNNSFKNTNTYTWLMEHAEDYGFVLRYPEDKENITGIMYEPWHFRYVGVEHAKKMNELHMCLEEYVEYVRSQQS